MYIKKNLKKLKAKKKNIKIEKENKSIKFIIEQNVKYIILKGGVYSDIEWVSATKN